MSGQQGDHVAPINMSGAFNCLCASNKGRKVAIISSKSCRKIVGASLGSSEPNSWRGHPYCCKYHRLLNKSLSLFQNPSIQTTSESETSHSRIVSMLAFQTRIEPICPQTANRCRLVVDSIENHATSKLNFVSDDECHPQHAVQTKLAFQCKTKDDSSLE